MTAGYEVKPTKIIVSFNSRLSLDLDIDTFHSELHASLQWLQ